MCLIFYFRICRIDSDSDYEENLSSSVHVYIREHVWRLTIFKMAAPIVNVTESEATVSQKLCELVVEKANAAIKDRGLFVIGVSGKCCIMCHGLLPRL